MANMHTLERLSGVSAYWPRAKKRQETPSPGLPPMCKAVHTCELTKFLTSPEEQALQSSLYR